MQYIIDNLNQYLPEHAWPQVLSALRQDPLVWNSLLENQPLGETMFAQAGDNPTLWSPASLALAAIGQPINTAKNPSSEIRKTASAFLNDLPSSISIPSNETYSMEQAGWVAIGLQERLNNGTTWDSIKNDFAPCPTEFWKTPLACLFGLLPHPEDFIIDLLAPNSTAEHRRLGIHAVLSNPLSAEQQAALFYKAVRQHELASQVSLLGMISVQRQDIGKLLASQLTVDIEMQENQSLSNLHAIEERMLQAEVHQYGGEHSKALPALQSSWDAFQNYHYQLAAKLAFSAAYKNDSFSAVQTLEHANKIGANLGIKSADIALAKLALGQPSEFTSKQIGLELQAEPDEAYSQAKLAVQSNQLDAAYLAAKNALDQINQTYTSNTDSQGHDNFFRNQAVLEGLVDLFLELGHPGDASKSALLALSTNPNSPQLLSKLSAIQAKSGQTSNAVNTAQIAAALEPENLTYRRRLAEALVDAKEWSAANDQFAKVITDQQNPSVNDLLHMATCSLHLDQVQRAEDICKQAIELDPENGMAYTILGEIHNKQGNPKSAGDAFSRGTELSPIVPDTWLKLANFQAGQNDLDASLVTLQQGIHSLPNNPEMHFALGKMYLSKNLPEHAKDSFQKAATLAVNGAEKSDALSPEFTTQLAKLLFDHGFIEETYAVTHKAHQAFPDDPKIAHLHAKSLISLDDPAKAIEVLAIALQADPKNIEAHLDHIQAHLADNRAPEDAVKAANLVLEYEPGNLPARGYLAEATAKSKDWTSALDLFQQAIATDLATDPKWASRLYVGLSEAAIAAHTPETAITVIEEALPTDPTNVAMMKTLSSAYEAADLKQDALSAAKEIVSLEPNHTEHLLWFADRASDLGYENEAGTALQQALETAPEKPEILLKLGATFLRQAEPEQAKSIFQKLFTSPTATSQDLQVSAKYLSDLGEFSSSIRHLEKALETPAENVPELLMELTSTHRAAGNNQGALDAIEKSIILSPEFTSLYTEKAELLLALNKPKSAVDSLRKAVELSPGDANLLSQTAALFFEIGDLAQALNHAEEALSLSPTDLALKTLVAEIAMAGLIPERARLVLAGLEHVPDNAVENPSLLFLLAEQALDTHDFELASQMLVPLVDENPISPKLIALQARIANAKGDSQLAEGLLLSSVSEFNKANNSHLPRTALIKSLYAISEAALELLQWDTALNITRQMVNISPGDPRSHFGMARFYVLRAEHHHNCISVDAKYHALDSSVINARSFSAFETSLDAASRNTPFEQAKILLTHWHVRGQDSFHPQDSKTIRPVTYPASPQEAAAFICWSRNSGDIHQAISAASGFSADAQVQFQTSLSLREEDPDRALQFAEAAIATEPENPLYLALVAQINESLGDKSAALIAINHALAVWPQESSWRILAGNLEVSSNNPSSAVEHLEKAAKSAPLPTDQQLLLAKAYLMSNAVKQGIGVLEEISRNHPDDPEVHISLAEAHSKSGNHAQAAASAQKAAALLPNQINPLLLTAGIYLDSGNAQSAHETAVAALKIAPQNLHATVLLARALDKLGKTREAIVTLDNKIANSVDPLPLQLARAKLLSSNDKKQSKLTALQDLAEQYPDEPSVLQIYSQALAEDGDIPKAIKIAQHAIRSNSESLATDNLSELHNQLGGYLSESGQLDQAIHHLSEAVRLGSNALEPMLALGQVHQKRRQFKKALDVFIEAAEIAPNDARPLFHAGIALKESKNFTAAESMLRCAAEIAPKDLDIQRQLGAVVALTLVHPIPSISTTLEATADA